MRSYKHWTARYVLDRSLNLLSDFIHPHWPWLTRKAVRFLEVWLKPTDNVFEWGSGRSTLWLAQQVRRIISIETDAAWLELVWTKTMFHHLDNVELKFCPDAAANRTERDEYVSAIANTGKDFDLVIVDGPVKRDLCALAALPNVKPGGLLLLDNVNWYLPSSSRSPSSRSEKDGTGSVKWAQFAQQVSNWRLIWTTNGVFDTAIWVKPTAIRAVPLTTGNEAWRSLD